MLPEYSEVPRSSPSRDASVVQRQRWVGTQIAVLRKDLGICSTGCEWLVPLLPPAALPCKLKGKDEL